MRPWIATRTTEIVGLEDDILVNYISEMLEDPDNKVGPAEIGSFDDNST